MKEQSILAYQKETWKRYKAAIGLPDPYNYLYGNPVKVHVPIDTAEGGLMIIGAYPTAHFNVIKSIRDVPVEDHLYPFSNEIYFDGSSINCVKSGKEIEEYFLDYLGISRNACWITDLVKVFLFKEGHIKKYQELNVHSVLENRSRFNEYAEKSISYIHQEIALAKPKAIIGLGTEVNSVLLESSNLITQAKMLASERVSYNVFGEEYSYFPVAHPGILMRNGIHADKWRGALNKSLEQVKQLL